MSSNDFEFIASGKAVQDLASEIRHAQSEGRAEASYIDTEADSLHHYSEKLCLIQLSVADKFYLIDPLAVDAKPLLDVLDDRPIWLHGADYDLTLFKRTYGWMPRVVRDTQIAARLVGHAQFGLAALVQHHFAVTLSKASQKADWSQRPLPSVMQSYAVDDVRYLRSLADQLMAALGEKKRIGWFEQSCSALCGDVLARTERSKEDPWRVNGCGKLHPKGLAFLREAWSWRDGIAKERDVPAFRVLNNQDLVMMATDFEAGEAFHLPQRWRPAWKQALVDIVHSLLKSDPATWPGRPKKTFRRITDEERDRVEKLCQLRDRRAESLGLESSVLGSRSTLEDLIINEDESGGGRLMSWQREILEV